jgi:alkaline phosphatase D
MRFLVIAFAVLVSQNILFAGDGNHKLISGPMQGHTTTTYTNMWIMVQDATMASVTLIDTLTGERYTTILKTEGNAVYEDYFPLLFEFNDLPTNHVYRAEITVDSEHYDIDRIFHTAKTDITETYRFMFTSCALSVPFGFKWLHPGIEDNVYKYAITKEADFSLWVGDYLYFRPRDARQEEGMTKRWVWKRKLTKIATYMEQWPQYSIWDDHEFGPNDGIGNFAHKKHSLGLFQKFWGNPGYGSDEAPGCYFKFDYLDSEFFMLDDRYYRTLPEDSVPTMLGATQLAWFKQSLKESKAVFKFVGIGSQTLNQVTTHECYWQYKDELNDIIQYIKDENISGVIFLTGDRHHSELLKLDVDGGYPLYEFTSSGITSFRRRTRRTAEATNFGRVPGTLADYQNFGRVTIEGETGNRVCVMEIFDNRGKQVWEYRINQNELTAKPRNVNVPVKVE